MGKSITLPLNNGAGIDSIVATTAQNLQAQGYSVQSSILSPQSASILVSKDNDGIKNLVGLGLECTVNLNIFGANQLTANIESKWTNKIIALCVGWFLCWVPIVTGIIGCINQSGLPDKIISSLQSGVASANNPYGNQFNQQTNQYNQGYSQYPNNNQFNQGYTQYPNNNQFPNDGGFQ